MSVWITGDIHGNPIRFDERIFYEQKEFSGDKEANFMIVLGDFALVWDFRGESEEEKRNLDWLEEKPFTTVFVDGNHSNHWRLKEYPVKEWHGGKVHEIRPHVLHLIRGEIFEIEENKFFAFGGASSHDIDDGILDPETFDDYYEFLEAWKEWDKNGLMFRVKGRSWWTEELPSEEEMLNGMQNLDKHDWKVDYILTHSPSASVVALLGNGMYQQDILTKYLEEIRQKTEYKRWFFGHMHQNMAVNENDILLYEQIVRIL